VIPSLSFFLVVAYINVTDRWTDDLLWQFVAVETTSLNEYVTNSRMAVVELKKFYIVCMRIMKDFKIFK